VADNQTARRAIEKDVAVIQQRLSKCKDQSMEVKTHREYRDANEMATATTEVGSWRIRSWSAWSSSSSAAARAANALIAALTWAARHGHTRVHVEADSQLLSSGVLSAACGVLGAGSVPDEPGCPSP
jgi:ribonuclease HI